MTAPGCRTAGAADVNDRGQIVGWGRKDPEEFYSDRAILWQGGRGYALDRLVRGMRAGWRLRGAGAVNRRGQILCAASYRNDTQRACLLTPAGGEAP